MTSDLDPCCRCHEADEPNPVAVAIGAAVLLSPPVLALVRRLLGGTEDKPAVADLEVDLDSETDPLDA